MAFNPLGKGGLGGLLGTMHGCICVEGGPGYGPGCICVDGGPGKGPGCICIDGGPGKG